jgi:hypothetical protein
MDSNMDDDNNNNNNNNSVLYFNVLTQQLHEPITGNKINIKNRKQTKSSNKSVSIMVTIPVKAGLEPSPETCLSNRPVSKAAGNVV